MYQECSRWRQYVSRPSKKCKITSQKAWKEEKKIYINSVPEEPEESFESQSINASVTTSAVISENKFIKSEDNLAFFQNDKSVAEEKAKCTIFHDLIWVFVLIYFPTNRLTNFTNVSMAG